MEQTAPNTMPELIATSINSVMGGVRTLLKTERNADGDYRFASIDGFLKEINPLCAKADLIIIQDEIDARLVHNGGDPQDRSWLWTTYEFHLAHTSGALWGPISRSVMVAADGAQAFGAAQSYALKQFMRALFQIPTGEADDADFRPRARPTRLVVRRPSLADMPIEDMAKASGTTGSRPAPDGARDGASARRLPVDELTTDKFAPNGLSAPAAEDDRPGDSAAPLPASPPDAEPHGSPPLSPDTLAKRLAELDTRRHRSHDLWPHDTAHPLTERWSLDSQKGKK